MEDTFFPEVKINPEFRQDLKQKVIASFENSQKSFSILRWLLPVAGSFAFGLLLITLVKAADLPRRFSPEAKINSLEEELTTLEKDLMSDNQISAAVEFNEL